MAGDIRISVVICTYNRADLLAQVVETLCVQTANSTSFEVIIIDNNSTDNTASVAANFVAKYPNIRYCFEAVAGASNARNRGWQEAHGDYVAFTDDDCKIPPGWVSKAIEIIDSKAPTIFGGPYYAFYDSPKPEWFKDAYGSSVMTQVARPVTPLEFIPEGNLFCKRDAFERFGGLRTDLGPTKTTFGFGEGTDWQLRARTLAPDMLVYYDPELFVYHLVKPDRFKWSTIISKAFQGGRINYNVFGVHANSSRNAGYVLLRMLWHLFQVCTDSLLGLVWRDRTQYAYIQNYWYEHTSKYLLAVGYDLEEFRASKGATKS